jgi:hypothetical protein
LPPLPPEPALDDEAWGSDFLDLPSFFGIRVSGTEMEDELAGGFPVLGATR